MKTKKLYKSKDNKIFFGIVGGIGEYFDIDPTILRIIWALVAVVSGFAPGVLLYIIAIFLIPENTGKVIDY